MFTGIVQSIGEITAVSSKKNFKTLATKLPHDLLDPNNPPKLGASIAHDGVCLTLVKLEVTNKQHIGYFDVMQETLDKTSLGELKAGSKVNLERAMRLSDEIGGHLLSGHVYGTGVVDEIQVVENNYRIFIKPETAYRDQMLQYVFHKGFIALNGVSLTITAVEKDRFSVSLIPETLKRTNLSDKDIGDKINIEIDSQTQSIVDTVRNYLANQLKNTQSN